LYNDTSITAEIQGIKRSINLVDEADIILYTVDANIGLNKEDRSIVTEIPGTTRDWIEAFISIEGIPVRLIDTAGLRETADSVEKIGVERSRQIIDEANLVLYLIDGAQGITAKDRDFISEYGALQSKQLLLLWNKADIAPPPSVPETLIAVSAKTGEGQTELTTALVAAVSETDALRFCEHDPGVGTVRQKTLIDTAYTALEEALALAEQKEPLDLIAPLLREAVNALGEITGEISTADILEEMFSRFCVGK
jgi:tRNA modification GTPase